MDNEIGGACSTYEIDKTALSLRISVFKDEGRNHTGKPKRR
jgi:hypothetical protein